MSRTTVIGLNDSHFDLDSLSLPPFYDLPKRGDFDFVVLRVTNTRIPVVFYEMTELPDSYLNKNFKYATESASYGSVEIWVDGYFHSSRFLTKARGALTSFNQYGFTVTNLSYNTAVSFQLAAELSRIQYTVPNRLKPVNGQPNQSVSIYVQFAFLVKLAPNVQVVFKVIA